MSNILDMVIRSGVWRRLTYRQQNILAVLEVLANETGTITASTDDLVRLSGILDPIKVAVPLRRFRQIGVLQSLEHQGSLSHALPRRFQFTADSDKFRKFAAANRLKVETANASNSDQPPK